MNKKFLLTVCLAIVGVLGMKAQYGIVALHHEGNVTLYAGGLIQEAMDASVKGDTLYLSEGTFAGFTVSHDIVVLGSGEKTVLTGDITIKQNSDEDILGNTVFCGLNLLNEVRIEGIVIKGLTVRQCKMVTFDLTRGSGAISGTKIEMCFINKLVLSRQRINGLEVVASKFETVNADGAFENAVNFHYCNIKQTNVGYSNFANNTYINCIIGNLNYGTCINTLYWGYLYNSTYGGDKRMNSWKDSDWSFDEDMNCSYSDEELKSKGYLSTEGTVVGITGWQIPFTLEPFYPHVIDHSLDVDNINKTLKVTLKMNE